MASGVFFPHLPRINSIWKWSELEFVSLVLPANTQIRIQCISILNVIDERPLDYALKAKICTNTQRNICFYLLLWVCVFCAFIVTTDNTMPSRNEKEKNLFLMFSITYYYYFSPFVAVTCTLTLTASHHNYDSMKIILCHLPHHRMAVVLWHVRNERIVRQQHNQ